MQSENLNRKCMMFQMDGGGDGPESSDDLEMSSSRGDSNDDEDEPLNPVDCITS